MWPSIIALTLALAATIFVLWLFLADIVIVTINATIIYFIAIKAYADITKRDMLKEYMIGLGIGLVIAMLARNLIPLWIPTTTAIIALLVAKAMQYYKKKITI